MTVAAPTSEQHREGSTSHFSSRRSGYPSCHHCAGYDLFRKFANWLRGRFLGNVIREAPAVVLPRGFYPSRNSAHGTFFNECFGGFRIAPSARRVCDRRLHSCGKKRGERIMGGSGRRLAVLIGLMSYALASLTIWFGCASAKREGAGGDSAGRAPRFLARRWETV